MDKPKFLIQDVPWLGGKVRLQRMTLAQAMVADMALLSGQMDGPRAERCVTLLSEVVQSVDGVPLHPLSWWLGLDERHAIDAMGLLQQVRWTLFSDTVPGEEDEKNAPLPSASPT